MRARALDGVRVIDFGQYIAGPLAAMLLADQGAEVVRVEAPGGPRLHTPANGIWNRGKRSIVLDLKQDDGRSTAQRLIASADVAGYPHLTVKKIPRAVLSRCEWGHDDYSLRVENLPRAPEKPRQAALFDGVEL